MNSARVPFDKASLLAALVTKVQTDLKALERRQRDTQEAATHEENRAEHAKDTRATEQSYLARGLADRVEDLVRRPRRRRHGSRIQWPADQDSHPCIAFWSLIARTGAG